MAVRRNRRRLVPYQAALFLAALTVGALWRGATGGAPQAAGRQLLADDGDCTDTCDLTGGILSVAGAISGQCDCDTAEVDGELVCSGMEVTCCGDMDNAGGVVFYLIVTLYTFLGLAIICDEYFCESLDAISDSLGLSEDVAGATFMAAGSSAPELFASVVTVLITGGSEGLGTIVGSAVFNAFVISGVCAICAGAVLELWWYPLTRDCVVYIISIVLMVIVIDDKKVDVWESLIMLFVYFVYIYIMKRNEDITEWVERKWPTDGASSSGDVKEVEMQQKKNDDALARAAAALTGKMAPEAGTAPPPAPAAMEARPVTPHEIRLAHHHGMNPLLRPEFRTAYSDHTAQLREEKRREDAMALGTVVQLDRAAAGFLGQIGKTRQGAMTSPNEGASATDEPESLMDKVLEIASIPYIIAFKYTVPDCREDAWKSWYMTSFWMSIFWIGILSFFMVDFGGRAGCVIGIPGIVMGLVVLAAGTSVPDALASVLVAKNGQGDMAVANVIGSNIFNILVGLALPWLVKALIDGESFQLGDDDITLSVVVLLLYVVLFIGVIAAAGWKLTRRVGYYFIGAHGLFVVWNLLTMLDDPVIAL